MTETSREIAHTAIIDILRRHKVLDSAIVAEIMPVLDEHARQRYAEGLNYAIVFFNSLKAGIHNLEHLADEIMRDMRRKGAAE